MSRPLAYAAPPTPGPWDYVVRDDGADRGRIQNHDAVVCDFGDATQYYPTEGSPPEGANLALILAAPDLLAEVSRLLALNKRLRAALALAKEMPKKRGRR